MVCWCRGCTGCLESHANHGGRGRRPVRSAGRCLSALLVAIRPAPLSLVWTTLPRLRLPLLWAALSRGLSDRFQPLVAGNGPRRSRWSWPSVRFATNRLSQPIVSRCARGALSAAPRAPSIIIGRDVQTWLQPGARARPGQSGARAIREAPNHGRHPRADAAQTLARLESPGHGGEFRQRPRGGHRPRPKPAPTGSSIKRPRRWRRRLRRFATRALLR